MGTLGAKGPLGEVSSSVQGTESRPEQPALAGPQRVRGMNLGRGCWRDEQELGPAQPRVLWSGLVKDFLFSIASSLQGELKL